MSHIQQALDPGEHGRSSTASSPVVSGDTVLVRPELLERAAGRADAMEGELRGGVKDVEPETTAAARGLTGWATGSKLSQTGAEWKDKLTDLANRMGGVSEQLVATVRNYRSSDEGAAGRFGGIGGTGTGAG
ncbi:MAG: hypothetical protein GEV03_10410 [Streptosporangiales bacterium]|nr:hypothetical protein [Streptosporangiales bacterium]